MPHALRFPAGATTRLAGGWTTLARAGHTPDNKRQRHLMRRLGGLAKKIAARAIVISLSSSIGNAHITSTKITSCSRLKLTLGGQFKTVPVRPANLAVLHLAC